MAPSKAEKEERSRQLIQAIGEDNVKAVKQILAQPVDFSYKVKGDCPIHMAARQGNTEIITALLSKGDSANRTNENNNTPFHYTAKEGHADAVTLLLQKGANPKVKNKDGDTPLHFAVVAQPMDFVERLLTLKMNPNAQNNLGRTPLHIAVQHSRRETMEILLVYKANPNTRDKDGNTAANVAKDAAIASQLNNYADLMVAMESGIILAQGVQVDPKSTTSAMMKRVGVYITSFTSTDSLPFQLYCRRERTENSLENFKTEKGEEIASDIFNLRVLDNRSHVTVNVDVPLYSAINVKEQPVLKFLEGQEMEFDKTTNRGEVCYCSINLELVSGADKVFVIYTRPRREQLLVDTDGSKVTSAVADDFHLDIPASTFGAPTTVSLTVFDTKETFEPVVKKAKIVNNLLTDVYQVNVDGNQPQKDVVVTFPIDKIVPGDDIVIVTADESKLDDEKCLEIVPSKPVIENDNVTFKVSHFCIHVAVPLSILTSRRQEVFTQILGVIKRQRPATFFVMTLQASNTETVVLVEISVASKAAKRIHHWQSKGYERHGTELNTVLLSPSEEFLVTFNGNIAATESKKRLVFLPRRASFQPYRASLKSTTDAPDAQASISVRDLNKELDEPTAAPSTGSPLCVLKFTLPTPPPPLEVSKANKFEPRNSDMKQPLIQYLKTRFSLSPWIDSHTLHLQKKIGDIFSDFGVDNAPVVMVTKTVTFAGSLFQDWRAHTFMMLIDNTVEDTAAMTLEQLCDHVLEVVLPPGGGDLACLKLVTAMRACAHQMNAFIVSTFGTTREGKSLPVTGSAYWRELQNHLNNHDISQKKVWKEMEELERERVERYKAKICKQVES